MSPKKRFWISIVTGAFFLFAGVRDIVAPGFLGLSASRPGGSESYVYLILGLLFLGEATAHRAREKRKTP